MMNPPDDFIQAALAASPVIPVNNAIVFDQGGQAMMVPPGALEEGGDEEDNPPAGQESDTPQAASPATQAQPQAQTQTQVQVPVQVPTQTQAAVDPSPTTAESRSIIEMVTTQVTTATVTPTSAVTQATPTEDPSPNPTPIDTVQSTSTNPTSTMPNMRMSSSAPSSSSSASVSSSSTSSAAASSSAAAAATSEPSKPFTRSAPFIFLMVLGSLVIVAVAATLFSTFFRWKDSCGCLPCCRPDRDDDDDEDGLSDLVRSFDLERTSTAGMSRASSMRRPPPMMDARQRSLQNRSTLFANSPSQAGFLHTTSGVEGSIFESDDGKNATDHLYGGHGQGGLEIKNAVEGDIPGENESLHGIGPRHLGVEGESLK
jgi:hypothetical protein